MMIPHHQGAIDMALAVLRYGHNEQMRRIAQEIIVEQQQEIAAMRLGPRPAAAAVRCRADTAARAECPRCRIDAMATHARHEVNEEPDDAKPNLSPALLAQHLSRLSVRRLGRAGARGRLRPGYSDQPPRPRLCGRAILQHRVRHRPVDNRLLGVIRLGDPQPANFSPLYTGPGAGPRHGLLAGPPDLAVVSIGSNSVTFIDTATNEVKHTTYVGRSPHEAFFTPDGKEVWVTVRGEDYVEVLDAHDLRGKDADQSAERAGNADLLARRQIWLCLLVLHSRNGGDHRRRPPDRRTSEAGRARSAPTSRRRPTASRCGSR